MTRIRISALVLLLCTVPVRAAVILNEVYLNPPGQYDDTREYVELLGPPGMKLDGYAVAMMNGTLRKYYKFNSLPPYPADAEIDELFSLDGLELGSNGMLVIGLGTAVRYPTLLSDTNFMTWGAIWNGGLDVPGKLQNDGSNTIVLIRNRPGQTQADPGDPAGLRWGKDIDHDAEVFRPIQSTICQGGLANGEPCNSGLDCPGINAMCVAGNVDQFGDGNVDRGEANNLGGFTLDLKGVSTLEDVSDDLEIVDEISYEHERGWEYDFDARHVDIDSTITGLPYRHVHALDDPQGFNPDCLTRVDYRTKGSGWAPAAGATGEMSNGNNWQDTATEQWIRGEALEGTAGVGGPPQFFMDNNANTNPDAIQPYRTNVPSWLNDGSGADYSFTLESYQIMAGRLNPLAVAFIPGDVDRDGACDADDIAKIAAVFGDDDWVFSNSYSESPEGDGGDPATQTRPWDVDTTGDNGIEPSDLQWVLNFQGDATGRVVGVRYENDTPTPAGAGVYLNPADEVEVTITAAPQVTGDRPLSGMQVGDELTLTVLGQVTGGANAAAGQENGVMQYVHDLLISAGGVLKVTNVEALGAFTATRAALESPQGTDGDAGVSRINGHATSFSQGLASAAPLYRVTLLAIGEGSTTIDVLASAEEKFLAGTPHGVKVGHTAGHGNPSAATYPESLSVTVSGIVPVDAHLVSAASRATHGAAGDFDIATPIGGPAAVEPRVSGDWSMVLTFDVPVEKLGGGTADCSSVTVTNATCVSVSGSGTSALSVELGGPAVANSCITVAASDIGAIGGGLAGDNDAAIRLLPGDRTGDGVVNIVDLNDIKTRLFQPVDVASFTADINADGVINIVDLNMTKANLFATLMSCP